MQSKVWWTATNGRRGRIGPQLPTPIDACAASISVGYCAMVSRVQVSGAGCQLFDTRSGPHSNRTMRTR
jgi:hypothetical protein